MGVDFLKSKARSFTKGWDRSRVELSRRTLFTREPDCLATGAVAKVIGPGTLVPGDRVLVRAERDQLVVVCDLAVRAVFVRPPESLVRRISESGGYANGQIEVAHPTLDLVEVFVQ